MSHTTESESIQVRASELDGRRPALTIVHHPDWELVGLRATVTEAGALLGRSPRACLPGAFDVAKVSREHARVRVRHGVLALEDLESRNGTYVNGERVEHATLEPGDAIALGGVLMMVTFGPTSYLEPNHPTLLGRSWPLAKLLEQVDRVATNEHCVTLIGETGSGKELVAGAIHDESGRGGRLVAVNCGALAEGVLESELFGHVQGAFTGAVAARKGLVEQAEGGTLFLDEVTSTPPRLQTVLLRLLDNGTYRAVGGNVEHRANVRVIAAAQPDIIDAPDTGRFRADLWYRLSRRLLHIPPLRVRREDIPILARHFARQQRADAELSMELSLALCRAAWPGNVRQLRNIVERIVEASDDELLHDISQVPQAGHQEADAPSQQRMRVRKPKRERPSRGDLERLLRAGRGRVAVAAQQLEVDRKSIYRWIESYGIDLDALRPADPPE